MSPVASDWLGFAGRPPTTIAPASHASFASLRLRVMQRRLRATSSLTRLALHQYADVNLVTEVLQEPFHHRLLLEPAADRVTHVV